MSDHIAHIAICNDAFNLAWLHPQVCDRFKALMRSHLEDAHMGSVTRYADKWSADIVVHDRDNANKPEDERDDMTDRKLAFVLGSLTHRAADRVTKPITNCWPGHADRELSQANESKVMQDIFVWKEVFNSGHGELADPFTPWAIIPNSNEPAATSEAWFRLMLRRALISMHTIHPDAEHVHDWFGQFFERMQTFPKRIEQYAQLAATWPADKVKKYLLDKHFYDRNDALIVLARHLQRGVSATSEQVVEAHQSTPVKEETHSRYARALSLALDYLVAGSDLYANSIDLQTAKTRFDIGVPELALG